MKLSNAQKFEAKAESLMSQANKIRERGDYSIESISEANYFEGQAIAYYDLATDAAKKSKKAKS